MKKLLLVIGGGLFLVVVIGFVILASQDRFRWLMCGNVMPAIPGHLLLKARPG